jgi:uncharacterized protein (DUF58 family)
MAGRRIIYWLALAGSIFYYWASGNWLSAVLVLIALGLPLLSLLLSLPAMLTTKVRLHIPTHVTLGTPACATLSVSCGFGKPMVSGKIQVLDLATGTKKRIKPGAPLNSQHCAAYRLQCNRLWVCDLLGLIRLPVSLKENRLLVVRPKPVLPQQMPDMNRYLSSVTRPKPGGGYSENHELRLYRPGDNLKQIHWKLSAKTGDLIIREPMEAQQNAFILTMELSGTPDALDSKLSRLLGMSQHLAENDLRHRIFCCTGNGMQIYPISSPQDALDAIDAILQQPPATDELPTYPHALWRHHIGGEVSEVS